MGGGSSPPSVKYDMPPPSPDSFDTNVLQARNRARAATLAMLGYRSTFTSARGADQLQASTDPLLQPTPVDPTSPKRDPITGRNIPSLPQPWGNNGSRGQPHQGGSFLTGLPTYGDYGPTRTLDAAATLAAAQKKAQQAAEDAAATANQNFRGRM